MPDEPVTRREHDEDDLPIVGDILGAGDLMFDVVSVERIHIDHADKAPVFAFVLVAHARQEPTDA